MYVYHGGFQKYNRKVDIYEYHHISLMFVSIQLLCIGKFYAFCIARANLTLQGCWKRGSGPPVFGRTANQREQIMPTKLLLPPPQIFGSSAASVYPIPMHWITISYEFPMEFPAYTSSYFKEKRYLQNSR